MCACVCVHGESLEGEFLKQGWRRHMEQDHFGWAGAGVLSPLCHLQEGQRPPALTATTTI